MVCVECNGKGYRIINNCEVVCDECQGHGEHPTLILESKIGQKPLSQEAHVWRPMFLRMTDVKSINCGAIPENLLGIACCSIFDSSNPLRAHKKSK
jgi:hypothetical protein